MRLPAPHAPVPHLTTGFGTGADGHSNSYCRRSGRSELSPAHGLRATCATRLLALGVDIAKVQELLGHRHITTTQIYDKRRRSTAESASHDVAY